MSTGTVKWINARKGFGVINVDGTNGDVFVHANEVTGAGFRNEQQDNQRVEFEIAQGPKGPMAKNVRVIE